MDDEAVKATRLVGRKGGFVYEMSVEVEDRPVKIYDKDEQTKGITRDVVRGYIASQEGKRYVVKYTMGRDVTDAKGRLKSHPGVNVQCFIDGTSVDSASHTGERSIDRTIRGRRTSGTRVYKFVFSPPQTTEEETPSINLGELGIIELQVRRCCLKQAKGYNDRSSKKQKSEKISSEACILNEKAKKGSMIGAVTTFGEGSGESSADEEPSSEMCPNATAQKRRRTTYYFHPKDRQSPFFKLRLRYAPEELLVANSHMPGKMEDESDPAHPSHTSPTRSPSPAGSGLLLLQPEFDLDSDPLSDVSSSSDYSSSSPHASQTDDDTDTADDSLDDQREAFKRPRSPERNEPGSDEDDKKRIKVLHGVGTKEDDPIEIDDDESDDEAVLARAVAEIHRLNELEELQAEEARIELQRQQVQARIAALRREEEPQHVQDTVKEESVAEAVPAAVAIAEAAVMGNATANADVIPKQEVKEEN